MRRTAWALATAVAVAAVAAAAAEEIKRLAPGDVTAEVFQRYMDAGELLVVDGGAADWPALQEWDLDWFTARFGDDAIQLRASGRGGQQLERPALTLRQYAQWVKGREQERHYFSWVNNDANVSATTLRPWIRLPPYFPPNAHASWHSEWLYFGTRGSGIDRHTDSMCSAKYSVQLRGTKRWTLSSSLHADPTVYTTTLSPGDLLLFYPQHWHETETLTASSLSFNSYFDWENTDNPFLRSVVRAASHSPRVNGKYGNCFRADADKPSPQMLALMCAELMRNGAAGATTPPNVAHMCSQIEHLSDDEIAAAMDDGSDADLAWRFAHLEL